MELLLHVQQPQGSRYRVIRLTCKGNVSGEDCRSHIVSLWGTPQQATWFIGGRDIRDLVPGKPPFINRAVLTTAPKTNLSEVTPDTEAPLFKLRVLHGPDSQTAFPLTRGNWPVGRQAPLLRIQDPALSPIEGYFLVQSTGIVYRADHLEQKIKPGEVFQLGSSICSIDPWDAQPVLFRDPEAVELDVPAPRSKVALVLMAVLPIGIGCLIAWFTQLWFILLMACGSSLLMGIHALSQGKETGQFRRLVAEAVANEQAAVQKFCGVKYLAEGSGIALGRGTRKARIQGKHRDIANVPFLSSAPWLCSTQQLSDVAGSLPAATQRLALCQLINTGIPIYVLIRGQEHFEYLRLVEPLVTFEHVQLIDSGELPELQNGLLICSAPVPDVPDALTQFVLTPQATTGILQLPGWDDLFLDGITAETYTSLLSQSTGTATASRAVQTAHSATSEIPFFASPAYKRNLYEGFPTGYQDLSMYVGQDLDTHQDIALGLATHGPHFLCAGTTGSGKSQLLRTMLWSLALRNSPQRLALVLVDFKGGAGLGPLASLPHTSLFISDLETATLQRSLKYLKADLKKRERLFRSLGVSSYEDYQSLRFGQQQYPEFPEVVLCIDEFRMLVDSFPDIMNEIIRIATIGRSLGYHLILATQRPQGALSQDIRTNISTVLCLRVNSSQDSYNILESDDAATLPASKPGRGFLRDSENRLISFQAPLLTGFYSPDSTAHCSAGFVLEENKGAYSGTCPISDQDLSQFNAQLEQVYGSSTYMPVLPELTPTSPPETNNHNLFGIDLGTFEIPESSYQGRFWWSSEDGPFLMVGNPIDRAEHLKSTLSQAAGRGYAIVCCTASEQSSQELRTALGSSEAINIYSIQDLEFIRFVLADMAQNFPHRTLLVIDGLDSFLESLIRYPLSESHLLEILQQAAHHQILTLCTSLAVPRGKWQALFPYVAFTQSAVKNDPTRSTSKTYSIPTAGQFALEGPLIELHGGPKVEAGTLCWSLAPTDKASLATATLSTGLSCRWKQLPTLCTVADVNLKTDKPNKRLAIGLDRWGKVATVPETRGGFMTISGPRGSGKTTCLKAIAKLNRSYPMVYIPAGPGIGVDNLREIIDRFEDSRRRPILLIDDIDKLSPDVQHLVLSQKEHFELVLVAYTPWPRWSSSPILSALNGTATGIVLQPEIATDLSFYPGHDLPLDLKTMGKVPPGRAVIIEYSDCYPVQVAFTEG